MHDKPWLGPPKALVPNRLGSSWRYVEDTGALH